ncbi:MAG TPA: ATP-binding protein [Symbiobacteriaceae bacterium]|nr:ATP-binding protein [Symbiobacteriaceae bacterium]
MQRLKHPYALAVALVILATAAGKTLLSHVAPTNQVMLYLLAVVISGLRLGRNATVLTTVLGVLAFDFFFVPPTFRLTVHNAEYLITFAALLLVALVIGTLTSQLREHAAALKAKQAETAALYAFSSEIVTARDLSEVARCIVDQLASTFDGGAQLVLPDGSETVSAGYTSHRWVTRLSLSTANGEVGILTVTVPNPLESDRRVLLDALAAQAAVVIERGQLAEGARKAELVAEAEKLHAALLHSISHSLRTPLASIIGSLSTILDPSRGRLDPDTRIDLVQTAREEAERLDEFVGDLLDMARVEAGHLKLLIDLYDLGDVIGAGVRQAERALRGRSVQVEMPRDLPLVPLDQVLIVEVIENLLSNAAKYSPVATPIEIAVSPSAAEVRLAVSDHGGGIPEADRERVFEKFYRVERPGGPIGTGLGLAICKGIVEAHGGRIWAEARAGGGTVVLFTLPRANKE